MYKKTLFPLFLLLSMSTAAFAAQTDLYRAVQENDSGFVQALVETGADVNEANVYEEKGAEWNYEDANLTPLFAAVYANNHELIETLLENNADVNRGGNKYWDGSLLEAAATRATPEILERLLAHGAYANYDEALYKAAAENEDKTNFIILLTYRPALEAEGKVEDKKDVLTDLLFRAIEKNDASLISFLVDQGANMHDEDELGRTPLAAVADYASSEQDVYLLMNTLIECGADVNFENSRYYTVLDYINELETSYKEKGLLVPATVRAARDILRLHSARNSSGIRPLINVKNVADLDDIDKDFALIEESDDLE